ncbi:uncharacterized protein Triagg1_3113 [Trichoderma aggressivum f. europaeum]|uniref:Uncharacterized protein n=1 Tax=Trichoderma aggressivum f. europaeum TaxID=173218 RepID=A0AAE1M126_9HYPO|nr:hypothetical protein Triagg1_3113 [Trichoderma aggressivum f. europaeum]
MEAASSPMKRRAVLGSLDANAALSTTPIASKMIMMGSSMLLTPSALLVSSPLIGSESSKGKKRTAGEDDEEVVDESPVPKKTCVDGLKQEQQDVWPARLETSSLFDSSAGDASWTTATEPDATATTTLLAATRPRALTREQAREASLPPVQKAEILRLRLGLAGYKLRTGQTSVPLSQLQRKPLPPSTTTRRRANTFAHAARTNTHTRVRSVDSIPHVPALSQESSVLSVRSDAAVTVAASQESVVVETRGNTPDHVAGNEGDKAVFLAISDVDSPSRVFLSSPAPAPVSSLRSTYTEEVDKQTHNSLNDDDDDVMAAKTGGLTRSE